jgi:hypothetical protein
MVRRAFILDRCYGSSLSKARKSGDEGHPDRFTVASALVVIRDVKVVDGGGGTKFNPTAIAHQIGLV